MADAPNIAVTRTVKPEGVPPTRAVEVAGGKWCFSTQRFSWRYDERVAPPAFNFSLYQDMQYDNRLRFSSLREAVIYAWGFDVGFGQGKEVGEESKK